MRRRTAATLVLGLALATLCGGAGRAATGDITEFPVGIGSDTLPADIVAGTDGNLWFSEFGPNKVGKITPAGVAIDLGPLTNDPNFVAIGQDGNLWFTEPNGNLIGRMKHSGTFSEFTTPSVALPHDIAAASNGYLFYTTLSGSVRLGRVSKGGGIIEFPLAASSAKEIAAGPDGNLWFTEFGAKIGRTSTTVSGTVEFPIPSGHVGGDITTGPDGNVWFTERAANEIGRITPDGSTIDEFPIPTASSDPYHIVAGPDGNLWFTERSGNNIGRITPTGVITEFPIPHTTAHAEGIAAGPDGNVWFVEADPGQVGRVTAAQAGISYVLVTDGGLSPKTRSVPKLGGTVQWMFVGPRSHSVASTDPGGGLLMGYFASGPRSLVSYYSFAFTAAGTFSYKSLVSPDSTPFVGTIKVPMTVKLVSGHTDQAKVTWATVPPTAPFVYDVQIKRPGDTGFLDWKIGDTVGNAVFGPSDPLYAGLGTYQFQARVRNTGNTTASGFSAPKSIALS